MLFYITEELDNELIKKWESKRHNLPNRPENEELVDRVFEEIGNPEVLRQSPSVEKAVYYNLRNYGIDPNVNPFVNIFGTWDEKFIGMRNLGKYIDILTELHKSGEVIDRVGVDLPHLTNPSLYKRNEQDFKYTVRLFRILDDKQAAKKYFRDTRVINMSDLYVDGDFDSAIKPVGHPQKDANNSATLIGIVNQWSEGNDAGGYSDKGKYSLQRILINDGVSKQETPDYLLNLVTDAKVRGALEYLLIAPKALKDTSKLAELFSLQQVDTPSELPEKEKNGTWGVATYPSTHPYETQRDSVTKTYWVKASDGWYRVSNDVLTSTAKELAKRGESFLNRKVSDTDELNDDQLLELVTKLVKESDVAGLLNKLIKDAKASGVESQEFEKAAYNKAESDSRAAQRGR